MPRKGKKDSQDGAPEPPPRHSGRKKAVEEPTAAVPPLKIKLLIPAQQPSAESAQPVDVGSASSVPAANEGPKKKKKKKKDKSSKKKSPEKVAEASDAVVDPEGQHSEMPGNGGTVPNREGEANPSSPYQMDVNYAWGEDDPGNPMFDSGKPEPAPSPAATTPPSEPLLYSDSDTDTPSSPDVEIVKERKRKARSDSHVGKAATSPALSDTDDELSRPLAEVLAADKAMSKIVKKRRRKGTLQVGIERGSEEPEPESLVFLIPQAGSNTTRRLTLPANIGYSRAILDIYGAIGCADVKKKPDLSYKLSTATQKSSSISLNSVGDWTGLLDDLILSQARKNAKSPFPVSIIVPEQYLISLRAHRSTTGVGASSSKRKKGKLALLDLNGDSDDEGDGGDSSIPEKEMRASSQLEAVLTKCQKCGTSAYCKIAADGSHVNLTFQQRRAWAIALAHGTNGVTLNTPPKSEQFAMFFKASLFNSTQVPTNPQAPPPGTPAVGFDVASLNNIAATMAGVMMMSGMMGGNPGWGRSVPVTPSSQHAHPAPQSSPPQPVVDTTYPTITSFLKDLEAHEVNAGALHLHNISQYAEVFEKEDFGYINELAGYTEDQFVKDFGMSRGNARFFHKGLEQKMKAIRRAGR